MRDIRRALKRAYFSLRLPETPSQRTERIRAGRDVDHALRSRRAIITGKINA